MQYEQLLMLQNLLILFLLKQYVKRKEILQLGLFFFLRQTYESLGLGHLYCSGTLEMVYFFNIYSNEMDDDPFLNRN